MWKKHLYVVAGLASITLYLLGIAGGYFGFLSTQIAFCLFVVGMLLAVIVVIAGIVDASKNGASDRTNLLLIALIPMANLIYLAVEARNSPILNDVSTDLVSPPEFQSATEEPENVGKSLNFPLEFKKQIEESYTDISPQALTLSVDDVYIKSLEVIEGLSHWEVTSNTIGSRETIIEGTITSDIFGFKDDFVIRLVEPGAGAGCVLDMRSRSRMGKWDMGQNAEHIRLFMSLIE